MKQEINLNMSDSDVLYQFYVAETLDELQENLREVIYMLLEDEALTFETEFVGTQQIVIQ